ncbi:uncharacterized protein LOC132753416 isoform X2 [Ruditapes philippinarum]|uniref:uncharacterized protein LOC132753416 isoform X2 n=1 Tax=Ruditapes philippinarum TaxID=129788 RepID=UPI00295B6A64|nr:uncharacterized protein LOC132753416 isoform X2 [Ruditapes philippinarum]
MYQIYQHRRSRSADLLEYGAVFTITSVLRPQYERRHLSARRKSAPGAVLFKTLGKTKSSNNLQPTPSMGKKDMEFFRPSRTNNNFNRQYLMEGIVEFSRGMQTQDRYLFLFSDLLLVAKQKSNTTFKLKHRIRVCELWIADCIDIVTEITRPTDRSFVIGWPTTNFVATFKSLELKETWLNKFKEQIDEERAKLKPKCLQINVQSKESDKACQVEVESVTDVLSVVKSCVEQLNMTESEAKDYQLWVRLGPDEAPYPLCGHELPYAIKLNQIRDFGKRTEDNLTELEIERIIKEMQANNRKYEFFLKHKKSQKRHSLDETSTSKSSKGKRKSPLINIFRRNRDDKKPQGKLFGHKLADVTTPENLVAKPIKELLTILFREGPYTVGILRKSCNAKMCKELRQKLDDGEDCLTNEQWPSLVIGALVKDYLRSIPNSLLMEELFDDWIAANSYTDPIEKNNKLKDTLTKLPDAHYELLRHLMCVLYHIDKKSEENKMTAYNLSVCIAPSLLWPKGNNDPLATPPALIQHMIENCAQVFGTEAILLFGDVVEQKIRQDSSTDSDSMHSVLSGNFRRDDSSIDSLDREILYSRDMDHGSHMAKSNFSPANLSGDSGLISDSQYYDEDGNGNDIVRPYLRSTSFIHPEALREDIERASQSLDSQFFYGYVPQNPVPPPRHTRRKGSDQSGSPNTEFERKPLRYSSESNFHVPNRYNRRYNQNMAEKLKRRSTESLKSVEESSEADSEMIMQGYRRPDIGTLVKSASGAHLYFEEPSLMEFDDINTVKNRRHLYKQSSEGNLPMSPQSKYSLGSSRDSVLSDSSGSFLNRQNSPDPLSSSVETPEQEECAMSAWLNQQSKHTAYAVEFQKQKSHDDSEIGMKIDRKPMNKMNYLVSPKSSPKTSPKLRRRSPIPVSNRRSFPLNAEISPKGSGSNTSKEAEDIIKSPKLSVTYCSQDSLDRRDFDAVKDKNNPPHLDIYNNNAQVAMKQLNIYSSGLQGTSPPPRVVLQGLNTQSQTLRRENTPVKGNHEILPQARSNSFDIAQYAEHKKYPMEENSVSSEDQNDSDSDTEVGTTRVMTMMTIPMSFDIPQKILVDNKSSSSDSISRSSSQSEELGTVRPENPPTYDEAVQRSNLLKQGLSPEEYDVESVKQASLKAKQLYEQSMRQYQEQSGRFSSPSQKFDKQFDIHEEHISEETGSITDSSEDEEPRYDPRKFYEESLKRYLEEQSSRSPLVKMSSADKDISFSNSKGGRLGVNNTLSPQTSHLQRSSSDVCDLDRRRSPRVLSRETTPTRRPEQPPPYNDPPPYHSERTDSSPNSAKRHLFPTAGEAMNKTPTQKCVSTNPNSVPAISSGNSYTVDSSNENAQFASVPKRRDNILVSNRARTSAVSAQNPEGNSSNTNNHKSEITDYSIHSAQSEIGRYQSPVSNVRSRDSPVGSYNSKSNNVSNIDKSQSNNVFRSRASSLEPKQPQSELAHPRTSSQGPISYRNPKISAGNVKSRPQSTIEPTCHKSLDTSVNRHSMNVQKELPWSVKRLSNIFDATSTNSNNSVTSHSQSSSPVPTSSSSSMTSSRVPATYTPPPTFQRYSDNNRSSTSSNSSIGSANRGKPTSKSFNKYGPQARDSFSSTDGSDCSCRYSLNCRRDNSSLEELTDVSFTDITYV